jgi:hypothetical protein
MQACSILSASSAALAVIIPLLVRALDLPDRAASLVFGLVLIVQGTAVGGHSISLLPTLYDIAPARERASYIGLLNTIMGPTSFVSMISGSLIDLVGFAPVFLTAGVLVMAGFVVGTGLRLPDTSSQP